MLSSKINSLEILQALARVPSANDTAQMARVFELVLEQSRFGWIGQTAGSSSNGQALLPEATDIHRSLLNHTAGRYTSVPDIHQQKPAFSQKVKLPAPLDVKPSSEAAPRSIPLLADNAAEKHGIPANLFRRLIWVESEFNPKAVSPKGAMGLGQLMPETARELGLSLDPDQGKGSVWDAESNLDASARYLKWLHGTFVDKGIGVEEAWRFSAAAYNAGIGNISRAMNRVQTEDSVKWDRVAEYLPQITGRASNETFNYLARLRL